VSELSLCLVEKVIQSSIDGIIVLDKEEIVLAWNTRAAVFTGIPEERALGRSIGEVMPAIHSSLTVHSALSNAAKGFSSFVPADQNICGSGVYESHYLPIMEGEEVMGVLHVLHDVSHRVKTENELRALNKSLAEKNRELKKYSAELSAFTHLTSNELRDPMRKIYTAIELLMREEGRRLSDEGKRYFRQIQGSVQRISLLADDILSLSDLDNRKDRLSEIDLNSIFLIAEKRLQEQISRSCAVISCGPLPMYRGYQPMLIQLFKHLLENALKFRDPGTKPVISISAENLPGSSIRHRHANPKSDYTVLHFTDNGIGFDPEYARTIFRMFCRLNGNDYPGTGCGLALCKKITVMHGGFIGAESSPGKGSSFHCYLENLSENPPPNH